jgi:hypothetical protein
MIFRDYLLLGIVVASGLWSAFFSFLAVIFFDVSYQGILQPCPVVTTIAFDPRRLVSRVGVCFRCSHQRILPTLPDIISRSTLPSPDCFERQLGLYMGWEHFIFSRVSFFRVQSVL